ncbi:MAG: MBOAT family protein, partial [Eubacterium sp.]|nr:MBOAT family protein [Eubacterium sp.]
MVFSSLIFLYIFLPAVLLCYYLIPAGRSGHTGGGSSNHNININKQARNAVLLIFSIIFYAWGEPVYVLGILASVIINFLFGSLLEKKKSKLLLALNIFLNLSYLAVFKYTDFCIGTINNLFGSSIALTKLVLPIGISFYTFQALSYTIDVYRGKVSSVSAGCPEKNTSKNRRKTSGEEFPDSQTEEKKSHAVSRLSRNLNGLLNFGTYLTMFPQLIAGPIVRYDTIRQELGTRKETLEDFAEGFIRFSSGLGKKVLLANSFGSIWDDIRLGAESDMTTAAAWLGMLCFSLQIYFDFSGYSDMAIGLGRMFGFHFNENFDYPYISKTITEFWRRWHISLSTWFKEYVYIPLGGNRDGIKKQIRNILIVWGLTGLWHGAAWSFVLWGLYYAILLITEKI